MTQVNERLGYLWKIAAEIDADAIVITTNGVVKKNGEAVMGRGIAKEAADFWPSLPAMLGLLIQASGSKVRRLVLSADPVYGEDGGRATVNVVCFPTKHHWREDANLELVRRSTQELAALIEKHKWTRVVLPRPGAGYGQLAWRDVRPILMEELDERCTVVTWG